jgi:hypothetical protein
MVVALDESTSAIYSAFLVAEEGTASSFRGPCEVIARRGLFCELHTDRSSDYFLTPKAGEPVSKTMRTQVGRALAQLGICHIAAYSPEARGRSERAFRTLQDRLPRSTAGRDHDADGGQSLDRRGLSTGAQRRLCGGVGRGRRHLRRRQRRAGARDPVPAGGLLYLPGLRGSPAQRID